MKFHPQSEMSQSQRERAFARVCGLTVLAPDQVRQVVDDAVRFVESSPPNPLMERTDWVVMIATEQLWKDEHRTGSAEPATSKPARQRHPLPNTSGATNRLHIEESGAGYCVIIQNSSGRSLARSLPVPFRAAAIILAKSIHEGGTNRQRYTLHLSDTGSHSFRLRGVDDSVLATSGYFPTSLARDAALEQIVAGFRSSAGVSTARSMGGLEGPTSSEA